MKHAARRLVAAALTLAAAGGWSAAAAQEGMENERRAEYRHTLEGKKVIFIPMAMNADANIAWHRRIEAQAQELGYELLLRDANWNTEAGARALTAAISEGPDLIVLQNPDVQSYARLIRQAQSRGIKVLQLNMESLTQSDAYVGADWQGIGHIAGQEIAAKCSAPGAPSKKIAITMGVPTAPIDLFQLHGFNAALEEAGGGFEIVSQQAAAYDPSKANAITAAVLQQHPDLCAVFGIWDGMDAGAGAAVKEAGKADQVFTVTSGGGAEASCAKLEDGIFDLIVNFNAPAQGDAVNVMISALLQSGAKAGANPVTYFTPNEKLTRETLAPGRCWSFESLER